ncbi:MAG TPA: prepilin-type N-terminal cleavage/methylation domain-containing protein [Acidimicrobiales bacterium]|nr:prepilin-type N-terminal cleavage/methylation domain-containing protein [Acidimicrobiales bacterium]
MLRSAARLRRRHQTGEGGFTLVEVMVAMLLLAIALTGLAQLAGSQMVASLRTRVRQVAVSYVNQELESLRSMTYTRLAMDPSDNTIPTKSGYTAVYGSAGCAGSSCLSYSKSVNLTNSQVSGTSCSTSSAGSCFSFTETRWVGTANGSYKTVFVTLTSTSGSSFTYSSQTDVSGATTNNPTAVTALEIDLQQVDTSGNVVTDPTTGLAEVPPDGFTVTVLQGATTIASGSSSDGSFGVTSGLSASTAYTCTVTNSGGGSLSTWVAYSAGDSSFTCTTGAAGTTTSYTSRWKQAGCTWDGTTGTGFLTAYVYDSTGSPASGVKVHMTQQQGQTNPPDVTTDATGQAAWNGDGSPKNNVIESGLFDITLSGTGYQTATNLSSTCIWNGQTSQIYLFIAVAPAPKGSGIVTLTVPIENTYPAGTATLAVEAVDTTQTYKFEIQNDINGCGSSCTATSLVLQVYKNFSYTVTVNCVGVGGNTPVPPDGEALYTWNTSNITANTTDPTTGAVKCPTS